MLPLASLPLLTALSPTVALSRSQAVVMMLISAIAGFAPIPVPCEPVCDWSTHDYNQARGKGIMAMKKSDQMCGVCVGPVGGLTDITTR